MFFDVLYALDACGNGGVSKQAEIYRERGRATTKASWMPRVYWLPAFVMTGADLS